MPVVSKTGRARGIIVVSIAGLSAIFAFLLLIPVLQGQTISLQNVVIPASVPWISELGIRTGVLYDPFTIILANVVGWVSFLIMVYSLDYMKNEEGLTRYWFFMIFFIGNMQLIVLSNNLLALFFGFEGVGLCSYGLISFHYSDKLEYWVGTPGQKVLGEEQAYSPTHAGMKAFVMTRIGDMAFLIGIIILFIYAKTFSFQSLAASPLWATSLAGAGLLIPVAILIFGGAVGKSAQFPLQEWLPDAMAGPAPVSALIHAATMVTAGVVLLARVGPIFYFAVASNPALIQPFFITVAWIGAFTAFLGATQGTVGFELKKILAYSTVSQVGYMVMAMGLTGLSNNFSQGLAAGLFQLMSHALFKAALFMAAGVLIHTTGTKYINEMGGLKDKMKTTFAIFLVASGALAGIPPLIGFWSKDAVLATAWDSGQFGLFAVGVATAGITAFYTFRMFGLIFYGKKSAHIEELEREGHSPHETGFLGWIPYAVLGVATVVLGLVALIGLVVPSFNIAGFLQVAATNYLTSLFPSASGLSSAAPAFNGLAAGITLIFVVIGVVAAWMLYIAKRVEPAQLIGEKGVMHGIYRFLENRWYINAIYYKVFVNPLIEGSQIILDRFEVGGIEKVSGAVATLGIYISRFGNWIDRNLVDTASDDVAVDGESFSRVVRKIETGVVEQYALIFAIGVVVILIAFLIAIGV